MINRVKSRLYVKMIYHSIYQLSKVKDQWDIYQLKKLLIMLIIKNKFNKWYQIQY
jgi:hypothetical protein